MAAAKSVKNITPTWCVECNKDVEMISIVEAALIINDLPINIIHKIENGLLHYAVSTINNDLFVCLNSLMHICSDDRT